MIKIFFYLLLLSTSFAIADDLPVNQSTNTVQLSNGTNFLDYGTGTTTANTPRYTLGTDQFNLLATAANQVTLDNDLNSFSNRNHSDLFGIDTDLVSFYNRNHNDLTTIDSDLNSFKSQAHSDSSTVQTNTSNTATSVASIDSKTPTLGQKTMAGSRPVVIASDQSDIPVAMAQMLDANNTTTLTNTGATYTGTFTHTRSRDVVRQLTVIASTVSSGLGGTFTFQYSEDCINPTISEVRTITDFSTVRDFDLINAGECYRVIFTPSRALTSLESIFITTTQRKQNDGQFVRLANQQTEEANSALGSQFSFLKAYDANTGKSVNIRPTKDESLKVADQTSYTTPSGSRFVESIIDDVSTKFTVSQAVANIATLVDIGSTGCNGSPVSTGAGQMELSTNSTANAICVRRSSKQVQYDTAHGVRGDMSVEVQQALVGTEKIEWGWVSDDLKNGSGWGYDATGIYTWRRHGSTSVYAKKDYQTVWNRDKCDGNIPSLFKFNNVPQNLNPLKNNLYITELEWLGTDGHTYRIKAPSTAIITANVEEYPNQNNGSSMDDAAYGLHIAVYNDATTGRSLKVRTGSWRGGRYSNKTPSIGRDPSDNYVDIRSQGLDPSNSTTTPLVANATYRGTWFPWQGEYTKLISDVKADVPGTFCVDFSEDVAPVNGSDANLTSFNCYPYNPSSLSLLQRSTPVQSKWYRHRYVNGNAAQSVFVFDAALLINDSGLTNNILTNLPTSSDQAGIVRNVPAIKNGAGTAYQEVPVSTNGNPKESVAEIHDDIAVRPLDTASASQLSIGTTAQRLDPSALSNRRVVSVTNEGPGNAAIGHSSGITFSSGSILLPVGATRIFGIDPTVQLWGVCQNTGGSQTTSDRNGTTATGTATNPSNALTNNTTYANVTANSQTINVTGYTAASANALVSVGIGVKGNKQSGTTETVSIAEVQTGATTGAGTVSSASLAGGSNQFYVAVITRNDSTGVVNSVSGGGISFTATSQVNIANGNRRIDVWSAYGTFTSGAITASLSNSTNAHIAVYRIINADPTTPIQAIANTTGTGTAVTGPGVAGTNHGMALLLVSHGDTSATPGTGYTEDSDQSNGSGSNTDSLATDHKALTSTATETGTMTLATSAAWAAIGLTVTPMTGINPTVTLSYTLSSVAGPTTGNVTFSSSTDSQTVVDITGDRTWLSTDIPNIAAILTGQNISAAQANIDWLYIETVDTTGNTTRLSIWQGAKLVQ